MSFRKLCRQGFSPLSRVLSCSLFSSAIVLSLFLCLLTHSRQLLARSVTPHTLSQWINSLEHTPPWNDNQKTQVIDWLYSLPDSLKTYLVIHETGSPLKLRPHHSFKEWQSSLIKHLLSRYYDQQNLAQDKAWQDLSGWHRANLANVLLGNPWRAHNQDVRGYADESGLRSPKADFISMGRHFFLPRNSLVENSVKCRLPGKYRYFQQRFPDYPDYWRHPAIQCDTIDEGFLQDLRFLDPISAQPIDLGPINTSTVRGFELLYATPGVGDPAEIAGHLVLRVLLDNNPQAEIFGIENPNDLVISFLADTKQTESTPKSDKAVMMSESCDKSWFGLDLNTEPDWDAFASVGQAVKGLTGGFLTVMDRQTLAQAVQHYTVFQDRNLLRFRLNLTDKQKESLLNRLYEAKKNYNGRYYFFKENCGSVLFRVIGEGIDSALMSNFNPLVTPPNAFINRLLQANLVTPVQPSFMSYRRRAHLAQEAFLQAYALVRAEAPTLPWPSHRHIFSAREKKRYPAYQKLTQLLQIHFMGETRGYHLLNLALAAEAAHANHERLCRQMSSRPTELLIQVQRQFLENGAVISDRVSLSSETPLPSSVLLSQVVNPLQAAHTGLQSYEMGSGQKTDAESAQYPVVTFAAQLYQQQMGDPGLFAMGQGTAVTFARVDFEWNQKAEELSDWSFTGLEIRKFKDRLSRVANLADPGYQLGLGLTVLESKRIELFEGVQIKWIAGELLANLWSNRGTDRFLFTSFGLALESDWRGSGENEATVEDNHTRLSLPLGLEAAWTFDKARHWQLRASALETLRWGERKTEKLRQAKISLSRYLGHFGKQAVTLTAYYQAETNMVFDSHRQQLSGVTLAFRPY